MEFKGTKGRWWSCCIKTTPYYVFSEGGDDTVICSFSKKQDMRDELPDEEFRANALLISKAPELLEMLKRLIQPDLDISDLIEAENLIKEATEI